MRPRKASSKHDTPKQHKYDTAKIWNEEICDDEMIIPKATMEPIPMRLMTAEIIAQQPIDHRGNATCGDILSEVRIYHLSDTVGLGHLRVRGSLRMEDLCLVPKPRSAEKAEAKNLAKVYISKMRIAVMTEFARLLGALDDLEFFGICRSAGCNGRAVRYLSTRRFES